MQASGNTRLKLLYLIDIFKRETDEEHALSVYDLIKELANYGITVSRQVLYEDVELLKDYGMDIYTNRQSGSAPTLYHLASRDFKLAELKLLIDTIKSSQFISQSQSKELIQKLTSLTSKYHAKELE